VDSRNVTVAAVATVLADQGGQIAPLIVTVQNNGAQIVYVGGSDVTTVNGFKLAVGASQTFVLYNGDKLYGRVAATTAACAVVETYAEGAESVLNGVAPLSVVLGFGNDAAGAQVKGIADAVDPQDAVALHQAQAMLNGAVVFQKTINFNTAGIAAGIKAMTFPAGLFLPSNPLVVSVVTAFNGTTPRLNFGWQQADATNAGSPFGSVVVSTGETDNGDGTFVPKNVNVLTRSIVWPAPIDLWVGLDDGAGGAAGSTVGQAKLMAYGFPMG
jgi:hypothetical protein